MNIVYNSDPLRASMSRRPTKATLSAKFVHGDKASFGKLRANSLQIGTALGNVVTKSVKCTSKLDAPQVAVGTLLDAKKVTVGSSVSEGKLEMYSQADGQGTKELVVLPTFNGAASSQMTFYGSNKAMNPGSSDGFDANFSKSLLVQGNLFIGDPGDLYEGYKTLFCKSIMFRSSVLKLNYDLKTKVTTPTLEGLKDGTHNNVSVTNTNITTVTLNIKVTNGVISEIKVAQTASGLNKGSTLTVAANPAIGNTSPIVITLDNDCFENRTSTLNQDVANRLVINNNQPIAISDQNQVIRAKAISLFSSNEKRQRNLFVDDGNGLLHVSDEGTSITNGWPIEANFNGTPSTKFSDDRLKHNETEIKNATATLAKIKPYVYDMTETFLPADYKGPLDEKKTPYHKESGFIAQEIQQIPELEHLVVPGDETTPYKLKYDGFLAFMVQASQERASEVQALKSELQALRAEVQALKAQSGSGSE